MYSGHTPEGLPCAGKVYEFQLAQREYEILKRIHQANGNFLRHVVRPIDGIPNDDTFVIVLELLGKPWADQLEEDRQRGNRITPLALMNMAVETTAALAEVYKAGVAHCDVKPENFLVSNLNKRIVLIDFDLAVPFGATRINGSDHFAPPEIIPEDGKATRTTDSFSWGRMWEFVLTGGMGIGPNHRITDHKDFKWVSQSFAELVRKCTEPNPGQRIPPDELDRSVRQAMNNVERRYGGIQFKDALAPYDYTYMLNPSNQVQGAAGSPIVY